MRLLISQGELGVMHPGNAGTVTEMMTFGASPCVILGVRKGTTKILAHIHKANSLKALKQQLSEILADASPADAEARAFIATETYTGGRIGEAAIQRSIIETLRVILAELKIALTAERSAHSAAIVTSEKNNLGSDNAVVSQLSNGELSSFIQWAEAYDKRFGLSVNRVPMAIRVGVNAETPEQAMIRMYGAQESSSSATISNQGPERAVLG